MKKFLIFSLLLAAIACAILRKPANPLESYVYRLRTRCQLEAHPVCVYCGAKATAAYWSGGLHDDLQYYHGEMISLCGLCFVRRIGI